MVGQPEDPADLELAESDLAKFEEETGVHVELDVVPSENVQTIVQTQLRSGDGPDVFGYDTGPGFAGALAEAGLLYPLTDAYEEYDWPVYDFAQERVTFDGEIVGIPNDIETLGLFYNMDLFDDLGIERPETVGDLMDACEAIKDEGLIPFAVSDQEAWQGGHLLSMVLSSEIGSEKIEALIAGETSWDSPEVIDALKVLKKFNDDGCFGPSPVAVTYDNANALFYSGQAAINPTGSWLVQDTERNVDFEVGYIPFPASNGPGRLQRRARSRPVHQCRHQEGRGRAQVPELPDDAGARRVGHRERAVHPRVPDRHQRHRGDAAVHAGARRRRQDRGRHRRLRLQHRRAHERHVQRGDAERHPGAAHRADDARRGRRLSPRELLGRAAGERRKPSARRRR